MPSQLPVSDPTCKISRCDSAIAFLGRGIMRRSNDPDLTEAFADVQAQRIWTIERAKHSAR